jgi:uncharacterized protein (DUF4213/DUF364 family)
LKEALVAVDKSTIERLLHHLQDDAPVDQVVVGAFWTAVVIGSDPPRCGLASTLRPTTHRGHQPVSDAGYLLKRSGWELAGWLRSESTLEASIGMAAFKALLHVDESNCTEINARDVILARGAGRRVAVVGHFPFVERVRQAAQECWVLELEPRAGDLPAEQATTVLPQADVVAITGTSLINHTFDALIGLCRHDAFVILLGGSTPLSPLLFDCGASAVSGTQIVNLSAAMLSVAQGATFPQIGGQRLLTMMREGALLSIDD